MALILCIETATQVCSVALFEEESLLEFAEVNEGYVHAEKLTLLITDVLQKAGKNLPEIDAVAVSEGPGSYTGLRIGVSTAKGICYSLNKPLIAVSTLESIAQQAASKHKADFFIPMIDARRMEVYSRVFSSSFNEVTETTPVILDESSYQEFLAHGKTVFCGDGSAKFQPVINHPNAIFDTSVLASSHGMIIPALKKIRSKNFEDVAYFEPFYLKEFTPGKKGEGK